MISVKGDDRLRAAVLILRNVGNDVRREINKRTRDTMNPAWRSLVSEHARTAVDKAVLTKGVRIAAGNPPAAVAATSRRRLRGGLLPADQWYAIEFGADQVTDTTYQRRSIKGRQHTVHRNTEKQLPPRYRKGRVVHPAFRALAPRMVSLWVQTIVRTVMDGVDKAAR